MNSPLESDPEVRRFEFTGVDAPRLTHYLFRFPAKFHPPVVHALIRSYTTVGQTILDPFCGSGTLLVAASVEGRNAIGSDIDPVAVFVSKRKTHRLHPGHLRSSWTSLRPALDAITRSSREYEERCFVDISLNEYRRILLDEELWVPEIPNLMHWFRRYVIVDLARILKRIESAQIPATHRAFFRLIHASTIRNASNADPVPVSGLEVTSYMKKRDAAGRIVNPFDLFIKGAKKALLAAEEYSAATSPKERVSVFHVDARAIGARLRKQVDAVITSPPYHNAVDYYRRHQLEMFWLGFTKTHTDRLELRPCYIGRSRIAKADPTLQRLTELGPVAASWHKRMQEVSSHRADAFAHYVLSMKEVISQLAAVLRSGAPAVFVLGNSEWNGSRLPTSELFLEIAGGSFCLADKLWYPVKNRYMSYGRHNGADINQEHVLVLTRT